MTLRNARSCVVVASVLAVVSGCRAMVEPDTLENSIGVIVSAPVRSGAATTASPARASAAGAAGQLVVYVSLRPGSVPTGMLATITDRATRLSTTTPVVNGGFDPVSIVASVGDTLTVEITGTDPPVQVKLTVAAARPLKVVRTSPPSGGRDVPLNAIMVVVFSSPIDSATLTAGSVQLWRDTTPVAGVVRFADSSELRVEFAPDQLLAAHTAYRLVVTDALRDVNGVALDPTLSESFTTGVAVQVAAKLAFTVQPSDATANVAISPAVVVAIQDSSGNTVTSARSVVTVTIVTNPGGGTLAGTPNVAAVNGVAIFSNLHVDKAGAGYTLTASASGLTGTTSAPFDITPAANTSSIIAFHSNHGIEEIGADGLGRAVLIADSTAFQPAWSPDGARLAFSRFADGGNACDIYTARADGSDEREITTPDTAAIRAGLPPTWCAYNPAWSPDGTKIAFAVGPRGCPEAPYCWSFPGFIYVVNADGSNERQLFTLQSLPHPPYPNFHNISVSTPIWSPDGSMIAFTGDATNGGDDLWWAYIGTAAGSGAMRLTDAGLEGPTWSPDGSQIAGGGWEGITLLNPDGSIAAVLTQAGFDVDPAWSPDGAHLVFTRWGTGSGGLGSISDLLIINRDGTGLRQLTTTGDASHPTWRSVPPLPVPKP